MSATRRTALGAALAAPLLTRFAGTASADAADARLGTISDGWVEVRWTREAQEQLDRFGATVEAIAPARVTADAQGTVVRFPVRNGAGDPSLAELPKAQGDGALDGGVIVRTANGSVRLTELSSDLRSELAAGKCMVNGVSAGHDAVLRCGLAEGVLTAETVQPGKPMKVRLADVPLRPTGAALDVYTAVFGAPTFTADSVLAHLTAEGVYHPPTA